MHIYKNQGRSFTNPYDLKIWNKILNMIDKSVIINRIIKEVGATSYLEIGYGNGHNFNKIECEKKSSCDPESVEMDVKDSEGKLIKTFKPNSDEYFEIVKDSFDVVFIDGLHHADQVRKDITNALKCNAKAIILHDVLPKSKAMQEVPRNTKEWTGDVFKSVVGFRQSFPEIRLETYRSDYGISVIYPNGFKTRKHFEKIDISYEDFKKDEVSLLNIID